MQISRDLRVVQKQVMVTASALHDLPKGITSTKPTDPTSDTRNIHLGDHKDPACDCNIPGFGGCGG